MLYGHNTWQGVEGGPWPNSLGKTEASVSYPQEPESCQPPNEGAWKQILSQFTPEMTVALDDTWLAVCQRP